MPPQASPIHLGKIGMTRLLVEQSDCCAWCSGSHQLFCRCYCNAVVQVLLRHPAISKILLDQSPVPHAAARLAVWKSLLHLSKDAAQDVELVNTSALLEQIGRWYPMVLEYVNQDDSASSTTRRQQCWDEFLRQLLCLLVGDAPEVAGPSDSPYSVCADLLTAQQLLLSRK